jgi:glycosyltransferase involved in cell wall biosynthesis
MLVTFMPFATLMSLPLPSRLCVTLISSCPDAWGGSEELWAGAARALAGAGHRVRVLKVRLDRQHPRVQELAQAGCAVVNLSALPGMAKRLLNRLRPHARQYSSLRLEQDLVAADLRRFRPHLTVISQGSNFDGMHFAETCRGAGHPYVLVVQKAVAFFFPWGSNRELFREQYRAARHCFFVAHHNLACTEDQLAMALPHSSVVFNPYNVPATPPLPYPVPAPGAPLELACVARLFLLDKGQDVLLRVLAQERWRARPVRVTFYGSGMDREAVVELAAFLGLTNVAFAGHVSDVAGIWARHHALVLPSRSEGLPLALVEAMLCGRLAIATDAGGITELLEDNRSGFVAAAPTVAALDEALERAWNRRSEWAALGAEAARRVRAAVPTDPVAEFVTQLLAAVPGAPTPAAQA